MSDIIKTDVLPPSSQDTIDLTRKIEALADKVEQISIETEHIFHGGIYTRTICVPAGIMITGALIKIPTMLTVSGDCLVMVGDGSEIHIKGYAVFPASAGRKQVFLAYSDTHISMAFQTDAKTVNEAEQEFTDETEMLKSNINENKVIITKE